MELTLQPLQVLALSQCQLVVGTSIPCIQAPPSKIWAGKTKRQGGISPSSGSYVRPGVGVQQWRQHLALLAAGFRAPRQLHMSHSYAAMHLFPCGNASGSAISTTLTCKRKTCSSNTSPPPHTHAHSHIHRLQPSLPERLGAPSCSQTCTRMGAVQVMMLSPNEFTYCKPSPLCVSLSPACVTPPHPGQQAVLIASRGNPPLPIKPSPLRINLVYHCCSISPYSLSLIHI